MILGDGKIESYKSHWLVSYLLMYSRSALVSESYGQFFKGRERYIVSCTNIENEKLTHLLDVLIRVIVADVLGT